MTSGPTAGADSPPDGGERPPIDVEALTDKVYRLLLADLRLDVARAGRRPQRS